MGSLFGGPDIPPIPEPPEPVRQPTKADREVQGAGERQRNRDKIRAGRSSTIMTGPLGVTEEATLGRRTLLG